VIGRRRRRVVVAIAAVAASFGAGAVVGVVYWLLRVPSPAPPPIALVGLLGMVIGERGGHTLLALRARRKARRAS
jgi:XapX domain-containing protein